MSRPASVDSMSSFDLTAGAWVRMRNIQRAGIAAAVAGTAVAGLILVQGLLAALDAGAAHSALVAAEARLAARQAELSRATTFRGVAGSRLNDRAVAAVSVATAVLARDVDVSGLFDLVLGAQIPGVQVTALRAGTNSQAAPTTPTSAPTPGGERTVPVVIQASAASYEAVSAWVAKLDGLDVLLDASSEWSGSPPSLTVTTTARIRLGAAASRTAAVLGSMGGTPPRPDPSAPHPDPGS